MISNELSNQLLASPDCPLGITDGKTIKGFTSNSVLGMTFLGYEPCILVMFDKIIKNKNNLPMSHSFGEVLKNYKSMPLLMMVNNEIKEIKRSLTIVDSKGKKTSASSPGFTIQINLLYPGEKYEQSVVSEVVLAQYHGSAFGRKLDLE